MVETFTLKKDSNNIPVCAFQVGANALNYVAWVAVQVVDDTQTTDANGLFTAASKPILDADGDGDITAADVLPRRTDTGVALYVGTTAGEVDSNAGEITLYTDEALTTLAASIEVKCTYWTLVPLAVDSSGRLVLAPTSSVEVSGSALPDGAATEATVATLATEATLNAIGVIVATLATDAAVAAVETALNFIKDTDGIKKITDPLPAGTEILGRMGIVNQAGDRNVHVHASLGDEEDFTQSLSSSAFLLTYDSVAGKWKRFKVSDIVDILTAIKDTDGIKKITDTVNAAITNSNSGAVVSASQTRPANTTAYAVNDVVGQDPAANMSFADVLASAGGTGIIAAVRVRIDGNSVITGMTGYILHLYDTAPTAIADNLAFNLIAADRGKYLGYIPITELIDLGDTVWAANDAANFMFKLAGGSTTLYGVLQTIGAYTPESATVVTVTLAVAPV